MRHALRQHQAGELVAAQLPAQRDDLRVVGRSFDAAIGAVVVVGAVTVLLAVRLVVLLAVAHEVGEGETVVHGRVIDAGARAAAVVMEKVLRGRHAAGDVADEVAGARPVAAQRAAVAIVPLRPGGRKMSDLVAARAEIPWLGDQLDAGKDRILPERREERRVRGETLRSTAERGGKIEAEAVDVARLDPVAQRVHGQLQHARMRKVERVARAGDVVIEARLVGLQAIVGGVVDAAQAQRGAEMVAFRGVIVDDVENDFDAGVMQPRHGRADVGERVIGGVARLGHEEAQRVVAPVVGEAPLDQMAIVEEGMDRQQLDGGDAESLEVIDHNAAAQATESAAPFGGHVIVQLGQSLDVRLVDDRVLPRDLRALLGGRRGGGLDDHRLRHATRIVAPIERKIATRAAGAVAEMGVAPHQPSGERLGMRVDQQLVRVKTKAALGIVGAVHAIAVKLSGRDVVEVAVPDVLGALGQRHAMQFAPALIVEQAQFHLFGIGGEEGEVGAAPVPRRAERMRRARRYAFARLLEPEKAPREEG